MEMLTVVLAVFALLVVANASRAPESPPAPIVYLPTSANAPARTQSVALEMFLLMLLVVVYLLGTVSPS